jgi:hypothetical protein
MQRVQDEVVTLIIPKVGARLLGRLIANSIVTSVNIRAPLQALVTLQNLYKL